MTEPKNERRFRIAPIPYLGRASLVSAVAFAAAMTMGVYTKTFDKALLAMQVAGAELAVRVLPTQVLAPALIREIGRQEARATNDPIGEIISHDAYINPDGPGRPQDWVIARTTAPSAAPTLDAH